MSALIGISSGSLAAFFLHLLTTVTTWRWSWPYAFMGLPIIGALIGLSDRHWGRYYGGGVGRVLGSLGHGGQKLGPIIIPAMIIPTALSHLVGASVGREGAAVLMSAAVAAWWARFFEVSKETRTLLIKAGLSAGFGAALGTPVAGAAFGLEVVAIGTFNWRGLWTCLVASFAGHYITHIAGVHHESYPRIQVALGERPFLTCLIAGIIFGMAATIICRVSAKAEQILSSYLPNTVIRGFVGGLILILFFQIPRSDQLMGLGMPVIQSAFAIPSDFFVPIGKTLATAISVSAGFKGGEFVPLVFIGSSLGSALAPFFGVPVDFMAALGFASLFAGAANVPITSGLMAMELFGASVGPYAFLCCLISYIFSTHRGVYQGQIVMRRKRQLLAQAVTFIKHWLQDHFQSKKSTS